MKKPVSVLSFGFWLALALIACTAAICSAASEAPFLTGKFAFQRATSGQQDAQLWLCEPASARLSGLTQGYPLTDAINPHFSPDGSTVLFGAVSANNERDIFSLRLGVNGAPNQLTNLNLNNNLRDEDAKFSFGSGGTIVFKQSLQIALMNPDGTNVRPLSLGSTAIERSGPFFTQDNGSVVFWEGVDRPTQGTDSDLYITNLATGQKTALAATPGVAEYYPTTWTNNRILFTRATRVANGTPNAAQNPDQLWSLSLSTLAAQSLAGSINLQGANSSDPFPINSRFILFSSTRGGGSGSYDLYVGDTVSGEVWPMSQVAPGLAVNTAQQELGVTYTSGPLTLIAAAPGAPSAVWTEDQGPVALAPGLRVNDDSEALDSASVTLPPEVSPSAVLSATTAGAPIAASYNALTRTLSLSGSATPAQYKSILRTVIFSDASQNPTPGALIVTFSVQSGAQSAASAVGLQVLGVNDAPAAQSQSITTAFNTDASLTLGATDIDSTSLSFTIVSAPLHGTLSAPSGSGANRTYAPARGYSGPDSFTFRANDGAADSDLATVSVQVLPDSSQPTPTPPATPTPTPVPANRAPVAVADSYSTRGPLQVLAAQGVLQNDTDADGNTDGNTLGARLNSVPRHGKITFKADGSFTYTPAVGYAGSDSFIYVATDGQAESAVATVTLTVTAQPDTTPPALVLAGGAARIERALFPVRGSAADVYILKSGPVVSSGLKSVTVQLQRSDGNYWNGRAYQKAPFNLPTQQLDRASFTVPSRATPPLSQALGGRYKWTATATDNAGNISRATQLVQVDAAAPQIVITTPATGSDGVARVPKLETVSGRTSEVARVEVAVRNSRGAFFNGRAFASAPTYFPATSAASTWALKLPGQALAAGRYTLLARATDGAGNIGMAQRAVEVASAPAG